MRWKAATVPLAAVTAITLLVSPTAWGQASPDPTPEPVVSETPAEESTEEPIEVTPTEGVEVDEEAEPEPDPAKVEAKTARPGERPEGEQEVESTHNNVHLYATPKVVKVGDRVRVWGDVSPGGGGVWVKIINAVTGHKIRSIRTEANGTFEGFIHIKKNVAIRARVETVKSKWRRLKAIPRLRVGLAETLLFGRSKATGQISKVAAGKWVKLRLRKINNGRIVERRVAQVSRTGTFKTRFDIDKPGTYRASAVFKHKLWRNVSDKSRRRTTPLPSLSRGSRSVHVKLLEKRLQELAHHLSGRNRSFGQDTADAVMAFNKVNRRARVSYVTAATWSALAKAHRPRPRFTSPRFHIEVDQSKQVLYVVRRGKVRGILHVSTGAPSTPTYDGTYQFWGKINGYSPGRLYYPSYFHGARAIHGWPEVPAYNASHGCVRVPMWAAKWIYAKVDIGDTIRIYH